MDSLEATVRELSREPGASLRELVGQIRAFRADLSDQLRRFGAEVFDKLNAIDTNLEKFQARTETSLRRTG